MKSRPLSLLILGASWLGSTLAAEPPQPSLAITLLVEGKEIPGSGNFRIPASSRDIRLLVQGSLDSKKVDSGRVRFKLQGFDPDWWERACEMSLGIRFLDGAYAQVLQTLYPVEGKSPGWNRDVEHSKFIHRREILTVPPGAEYLSVVVSSAGPSSAMGVYAVANLVLKKYPADGSTNKALLDFSTNFEQRLSENANIPGWARDGIRPAMAKVLSVGTKPLSYVLCIVDDDPSSHGEWRLANEGVQRVKVGERLTLEWDEVYSIGFGEKSWADYRELSPGNYHFRVNKLDLIGNPLPYETSVELTVTGPFWKNSWFLMTLFGTGGVLCMLALRNLSRRRMKREIEHLRQQHMLESERLRIARNIHDDLGARLTHISLASDMASEELLSAAAARAEFEKISNMARELVAAVYETVWTVDPKNDSLQSLVDFLCEITQKLCGSANIRCQLAVCESVRQLQISSEWRHNVSLAVKEAVHNAVRHSNASEIVLDIRTTDRLMVVEVRDNGDGFSLENSEGHGMDNMRRRMEIVGGHFRMETEPGKGTAAHFEIPLPGNFSQRASNKSN